MREIKVSVTSQTKWVRKVDGIFGRVERFEMVRTHHVAISIGKLGRLRFVSSKEYPSADAARRAARRMEQDFASQDPSP